MAINYASFTISNSGSSSLASCLTTVGTTSYSAARATPTTNNVVDEEIVVSVVTPATWTATASTYVAVYVTGSVDGTTWPDGMTPQTASGTATAAAINLGSNMKFLGTIACNVNGSNTFVSAPFSVAAAFGGVLPPNYAICVQNYLPATYSLTSASIAGRSVYYN